MGHLSQLFRRRTLHFPAQDYADQTTASTIVPTASNRVSNDIPRATLSVTELVELTMEFYRRNYIEGLFLSSGVVRNPDYTMERLVRVAKDLRLVHRFNGYIHLKSIPGASEELVREAGLYALLNVFHRKIHTLVIFLRCQQF